MHSKYNSYRGAMAAARTSVMSQETNLMPHENCFPLQIPLTQLLSWPTSSAGTPDIDTHFDVTLFFEYVR
ncbi:hypothetical protein Y1Q_0004621 [Alligator mississippiensis]|uniref:Uncharacterized protein n=1 Tax=Alligator mississippiensis TaxID=8496 RepID=A0A151MHN9_ALLMI|nr:hypothetical protein Y1Q_0004621 [Alligator mississippiensis]